MKRMLVPIVLLVACGKNENVPFADLGNLDASDITQEFDHPLRDTPDYGPDNYRPSEDLAVETSEDGFFNWDDSFRDEVVDIDMQGPSDLSDADIPGDLYLPDTGLDPGADFVTAPQNGGYPCTTDAECVSGNCAGTRCTCRDGNDCDKGQWCDIGATYFAGTANCLEPRLAFAGCTTHVQCASGACSPTQDGTNSSYCTECATGGAGCEAKIGTPWCCGGACQAGQGCLADCGVMAPPAPQYVYCTKGCWDPATQYCGPNGPTAKLGAAANCQFLNSWCLTNYCIVSKDGRTSNCSCDDSVAPCRSGSSCFEGRCVLN